MQLVIAWYTPVASKIIASAILLFRNATTKNRSVNWTTVNCPRGGGKKQCQIPIWGVGTPGGGGVGHEIDKYIRPLQINFLFPVLTSGIFACGRAVHFHYFIMRLVSFQAIIYLAQL